MKYVIYDKATLKVVHILDEEPISISSSLAVARTETIPKGDMFTVSNIREETEKYIVKEPKTVEIFKEELGETVEDIVFEEVEKERKYFTCDLIGEIKTYKPSYESLVEKYIREKYTVSQELAILRQRDTKPEEFEAYFNYAEDCKARAKLELGD